MTSRSQKPGTMSQLFRELGLSPVTGEAPGGSMEDTAAGTDAGTAPVPEENIGKNTVSLLDENVGETGAQDFPGPPGEWTGPHSGMNFAITMSPMGRLLQIEIPGPDPIILQAAFQGGQDIQEYSRVFDMAISLAQDPNSLDDDTVRDNIGGIHYTANFLSNVSEQLDASRRNGDLFHDPLMTSLEKESINLKFRDKVRTLAKASDRILDRIRAAASARQMHLINIDPANSRMI